MAGDDPVKYAVPDAESACQPHHDTPIDLTAQNPQTEETQKIDKIYEQSRTLRKEGKFDQALKLLKTSGYQNHPKIFNGIISVYALKGDLATARQLLFKDYPTKDEKDKIDAYFNLGDIYAFTDYKEARQFYDRAAKLGDKEAPRKVKEIDGIVSMKTRSSAEVAGGLFVDLEYADSKNRISSNDSEARTLLKKLEILHLRDGGTAIVRYIHGDKEKGLLYVPFRPANEFSIANDESFGIQLQGKHKLTLRIPEGTFIIEQTQDPATGEDKFAIRHLPKTP